jgi:hypothetical protein
MFSNNSFCLGGIMPPAKNWKGELKVTAIALFLVVTNKKFSTVTPEQRVRHNIVNKNSCCIKAQEFNATEMIVLEMQSQGVAVTLDKKPCSGVQSTWHSSGSVSVDPRRKRANNHAIAIQKIDSDTMRANAIKKSGGDVADVMCKDWETVQKGKAMTSLFRWNKGGQKGSYIYIDKRQITCSKCGGQHT